MLPLNGGDCCAAGLLQTLLHVLPVSRCDKWWYLYRCGSVSYAGSVSSQSECRPPSNRPTTILVPQTDPSPRCRQVGLIFILGGAPKAHEVSYENCRVCTNSSQNGTCRPAHRGQDYPSHRRALRLSNSSTLEPFNSCTIRRHFCPPCLFLPNVFYLSRPGLVFQSAWERGRSVRDLQSRVTSHESPVTVHRFHGQRRQRSKSSGNATTRLPGAHSAQHRPQSDRAELSLARAVQRLSRLGDVAAHAHPPC